MPIKIIAEIAQGYEGRPHYCELYVRAAAKAGADAVKFQIVYADDVAEPGYQYYDFYKTLEMDVSVWKGIKLQAEQLGIHLFVDVSGDRALEVVDVIKPHGIKIHSSNFFNRDLIRKVFSMAPQIFISIGGVTEDEIRDLLSELDVGDQLSRLTLLYGFQSEPTPVEKSCLNRLPLLKETFPAVKIGYLDHAPGDSEDQINISLMAMALGADCIEKHLTLNRYLEVEDYVSALEPAEFFAYVKTVRRLEAALGESDMRLSKDELRYRDKSVKKLIAKHDLQKGNILSQDDFVLKRTASVGEFQGFHDPRELIGCRLIADVKQGAAIVSENLVEKVMV